LITSGGSSASGVNPGEFAPVDVNIAAICSVFGSSEPYHANNPPIAAAAQKYFGKNPGDLTIAEAAYLAGLPKAPNVYRLDVADNLNRARERRDWVLTRMAADGMITVSAARLASAEPLLAPERLRN